MYRRMATILLVFFCCSILTTYIPSKTLATSDSQSRTATQKALGYLSSVQNADGGFPVDKGRNSSKITTAWAVMALCAAGENINTTAWVKNGKNPLDYLLTGTSTLSATTDYARMLLGMQAAGGNSILQGTDLAEKILSFQQNNGQFAQPDQGETEMINAHMWSILALYSAGKEIPQKEKAKSWLMGSQNADGGFGWARGLESDPDDTAVAVTVLALMGENPTGSSAIQKALRYLENQEDSEGGYTWTGQKTNSATVAWVIQGLTVAGINTDKSTNFLLSFQNTDGSFNWTKDLRSQPVLMTSNAIMALCKKPLPVNIVNPQKSSQSLKISLTIDSLAAFINGSIRLLDVSPVIINGSTYVPLRFVGEYLGAEVAWDSLNSTAVVMYQGQKMYLPTGKAASGSSPTALLKEGRTLVPLRYISEKMHATVQWFATERRIEIER